MADVDWEKNETTPIVTKRTDKWEGEDEEEDIKDNWDDEEQEEDSSEANEESITKKKKRSLAQIIAEKEERQREERKQKMAAAAEAAEMDPLADKFERQRLQEESDLMLAKEAFGLDSESGKTSPIMGLADIPLSSKEDFDEFRKQLVTKCQSAERSAYYVTFLENAFREICVTLESDDIKRISSNLNALFNEKIKAQKPAKAGKKNKSKGGTIKIERRDMDFNGGDYHDDMDDFI